MDILGFAFIALLLVISPGPNAVLVLKTLSVSGKQAVSVQLLGICSATFLHGLFSVLGISALMLQSANLFTAVKLAGAAYLGYLGIKAIRQAFMNTHPANVSSSTDQREQVEQSVPVKHQPTFIAAFGEGFITQVLNPKVSMFYLAAFPQFLGAQFLAPDATLISQAMALVTIHASMIFVWFSLVSRVFVRFQQGPNKVRLDRWVQGLSGAVMLYFSALIVTSK